MNSPRHSTHPYPNRTTWMAGVALTLTLAFAGAGWINGAETTQTTTFSNSPAERSFAPEARAAGDTKTSTLTTEERSQIKLDFIPADERYNRTRRGYPSVTAPKGTYGIEAHGSPRTVYHRTGGPMTVQELAESIHSDERYEDGMTVYLLCCETGKGNHCFAQKLADTLGTEVVAPTEKLWPQRNGLYIVAPERTRRAFGIFEKREQRADETRPGAMKTFKPGTKGVELVSFQRDHASETTSSSSAASAARTQQPPKKPLLRASAKTAALLAGIHGQRDSSVYLNAR